MRACGNAGPPPLPVFREGRTRIGRGGGVSPPLPFSKHYAACPGPRPGSRWPARVRPAGRSRTGAAGVRMEGEEESPRTGDFNPGCNYLVRGYSPSMHFCWGGDMPSYSPPLPFRRGRAGARVCWPARPGSRPRTCALAGGPAPVPGSGVAVGRAGWRARGRAPGRGRVRARWPEGPRGRRARGSRTSEASLRMGGEGECAQTGDSNAGCNYPVRGYSPSMHFFWGGDMPRYSPPLHFGRGRAGCRASRQPVLPF